MKKALITGIAGSGASYLAEYLLDQNIDVSGIVRWHGTSEQKNLEKIKNNITLYESDLMDLSSIIRALDQCRPDYIFHLASHANVRVCFDSPIAVLQNNTIGTLNLFEAIRILKLNPKIQFCSTSEVYGIVRPEDVPIKETCQLNPANIYAVSKLTQEKIAHSYFHSYGMNVVLTRAFTYINPRRQDIFSSAFARKIVEIEYGRRDVLEHGNLDSMRTLIDVRDIVKAYWVSLNQCSYGIPYNIGGLNSVSVGDFLEILKGKSKKKIKTKLSQNLLRPVDVSLQIPDVSLFTQKTGWKPEISLDDSVEFLLNYYRRKLK